MSHQIYLDIITPLDNQNFTISFEKILCKTCYGLFNSVNQAIDSAPPIGGGIPPAKPASINPVPALVDPPKPIVPAAEIQPPVEPPAAQPQPVVPVAAEVPAPLPVDDGPPLVQPNALPPIPAAAPAGAPAGEAVSYFFLILVHGQ